MPREKDEVSRTWLHDEKEQARRESVAVAPVCARPKIGRIEVPKARVYELAKELGVDSKTVLSKLEAMGEFVKSASSTVEPPVARKLRNAFASSGQGNASDSKAGPYGQEACRTGISFHAKAGRSVSTEAGCPRSAEAASCRFQVRCPKPGHRAPRPGESRQHGNRPNGNAPRPQGGDRRQSGRPTAVPGARPQHGNAPQGGNNANGAKPHTPGPRPGNNPFSRKQGMHTPTPGDIPRPHPMNRPSVNNGEGRRGDRPGQGGGQRGGFRGRPGQGGAKPGQWGQHRPGQGGGQRPAGGGNRFGGNGGGFRAATALRAMVRHVVAAAAALQARSDVREASPRRRVRTVWRSVRNSRR